MNLKSKISAARPAMFVTVALILSGLVSSGIAQAQEETIEQVAHFGGSHDCVAIQGNYAYLGTGTSVSVLDISGAQPKQVASLSLPEKPLNIFISGNYAYIADGGSGLQVVDISDPLNPSIVATHAIPDGTTRGVHVSGNYAYLAAGADGLKVVDVSDPSSPTEVGSFEIDARDVFVLGNYAYVLEYVEQSGKLWVMDITDPTGPQGKGSCETAGYQRVFVLGDYAYVANGYKKGIQIVDISDPVNPFVKGSFGVDSVTAYDVSVRTGSTYAYIAAGTDGLMIVDVCDSENPIEAKLLPDVAASVIHLIYPHAYVTCDSDAGFQMIDLSDSANPSATKQYEDTTPPFPTSVSYDGNTRTLTLTFDETIDVGSTDPTKVELANQETEGENFSLTQPELRPSQEDGPAIKFLLNKEHRDTISKSGRTTDELYIELEAGAVKDLAGNPNEFMSYRPVDTWTKDTTPPKLVEAISIEGDLGLIVVMRADESLTLTGDPWPGGPTVDPTKVGLANQETGGESFSLTQPELGPGQEDGPAIKFLLNKEHRDTISRWGRTTDKLYIKLEAGAVKDLAGNPNEFMSYRPVDFWRKDTTPPFLTSVSYNGNAGLLTLNFNERIGVGFTDPSGVKLANQETGGESFSLTQPEIVPGQEDRPQLDFSLTHEHRDMISRWGRTTDELYLGLRRGAVQDPAGNPSESVTRRPVDTWTKDTTPPNIRMKTPTTSAPAGKDLPITAKVADARTQVSSATLHYQVGGSSAVFKPMTSDGDIYTATVPAADVTNKGLSYYISAEDDRGNATTSMIRYNPESMMWEKFADGDNPQNVTVSVTATLPANTLPVFSPSDVPSTYRMLSVPIAADPNAATSTTLLADFGTGGDGWEAWKFDGRSENNGYQPGHTEPFTFGPGVAAWVGVTDPGKAVEVSGTTVNVTKKASISVSRGWNQIGNPFNFSRNWDATTISVDGDDINTAASKGKVSNVIYWFTGESSSYSFASADPTIPNQTVSEPHWTGAGIPSNEDVCKGWPGTLDPWGGYWVYSNVEGGTLRIDPTTPTKGGVIPPLKTIARSAQTPDSWSLELQAETGGGRPDGIKFAGVVADAVDGVDKYDVLDPPLLPDGTVRLSFVQEDGDYLQDMKPPADQMVWQFKVMSVGDVPVTIHFDVSAVPSEYNSILLIDTTPETRVDLRAVASYTYEPSANERELELTISKVMPGDFTGDNRVWTEDFVLFVTQFGRQQGDEGFESIYDLDGDGRVWTGDFAIFVAQFGKTSGPGKRVAGLPPVGKNQNAEMSMSVHTRATSLSSGGREFTVEVSVENATELRGYGLTLDYEPEALKFLGATPGKNNLLNKAGSSTPLFLVVSNPDRPGQVWIANALADSKPTEGNGLLVSFSFRTRGRLSGSSLPISLSMLELFDAQLHLNSVSAKNLTKQIQLMPDQNRLAQNYPNPFNAVTYISYQLAQPAFTTIKVYNLSGQLVRTLAKEEKPADWYSVRWDGRDSSGRAVASGIYFYQLTAGEFSQVQRMMLLK